MSKRQKKVTHLHFKLLDVKKEITLVWVNVLLAVCEDLPMVILTASWVLITDTFLQPIVLFSMLMSAGSVYLKCGKLLAVKRFLDEKTDLAERLHRNWLKLNSIE